MRKILSLVTVLVLYTVFALAQTKTITGKVTDEKGNPIPFATVKVRGSNKGVAADQQGNFSIQAQPNDVLIVSAVSFGDTEMTVGSENTVSAVLTGQESMSEVVVTALGIRRQKNTLPYAAQQISGEDVSKLRTGNAASALSG